MTFAKRFHAMLGLLGLGVLGLGFCATTASATPVAYVAGPTTTIASSSIPTNSSNAQNLGYAFKTGPSGPFAIDWVKLEVQSTAASTAGTFKIAIHGAAPETAYAAIPDSTVYAVDTVSYTTSAATGTAYDLNLTAADIPNITDYDLLANTAYSLFVYHSSGNGLALRRDGTWTFETTNNAYAVTNGFTMLDTFRNNTANYTNNSGVNYPAFAI